MISLFINSLTSGGAEKVVLTLLEKFRQAGETVDLVLIEKERFYEMPEGVETTFLTPFESLEKGLFKIPFLLVCAWRLRRHVKKNQIRIVQSHLLRASFINVFARLLGSPHHAQVVIHSRINFDRKPFFYRTFEKWVYRRIFHRADSILSICETMKLELDDYLNLRDHPRHLVVYNPHQLEEIKKKAEEETTAFQFLSHKKYIISVGRMVKGKRLDDLIRAFSTIKDGFPNAELLFVGDGNEKASLECLAGKLQLTERVHFLGYQANPFAYLAKSDISVLCSEWEGLPNGIIESLACGTPVISSDCISGPREILSPNSDLNFKLENSIEQGDYGLLYPVGDVKLLANSISKLLTNNELRQNFIKKGYERAKEFDAELISELHLDFFRTLEQLRDGFSKITIESPQY